MNEMIERVARALFNHSEQSSDQWGWDQHPPRDWDDSKIEECERAAYREDARIAIAAHKAALSEAGFIILRSAGIIDKAPDLPIASSGPGDGGGPPATTD